MHLRLTLAAFALLLCFSPPLAAINSANDPADAPGIAKPGSSRAKPSGALGALSSAVSASPTKPEDAPRRDSRYWPQGYFSGDPVPPRTVYLTFDDGPSDFTAQILDVLKEEGVRATFFLNSYDRDSPGKADPTKNCLERYAEVLRRMVDEGHAIGNHSYSHRDFAYLSAAQVAFQLDTLERQLSEVLGDRMPRVYLVRPPFGSPWLGNWNSQKQRERACSELGDRGIVMLWTTGWDSSDSVDWASGEWYEASNARYHPGTQSYERKMQREKDRILKRADGSAGGIMLMHDTHPTSRDVLKDLIEELKQRGYAFATLEDYCRWRWGSDVFARFDAASPTLPPRAPANAAPRPAPSEPRQPERDPLDSPAPLPPLTDR